MSIMFINQNAIVFRNTSERDFLKSLFHFSQSFELLCLKKWVLSRIPRKAADE